GSNGGRLYKTGDLGRFLDGGIIEYCGRADFQVKVRGFRIELTEIENVLRNHPSVKEVLVDTFESGLGNKSLVAYLVPVEGTDRKIISALKDFMRSQLPEYMVPSVFHFMEKFPLTSNGKIDRRKLPKVSEILPEVSSSSENLSEAQSDTEKKLADVWKEVLKLEKVGLDDNFFELGGDSIMSIQVIAKSNQAGIKITPKQMFMYPTIRGLALASETNAVKAEQSFFSGPVALSPIQHWFFEKQFTDENLWNQSNLFKLKERLDPVKLKKALSEIIKHHDMLRAFYKKDSNEIKQIIRKDIPEDVFYYIKADHSFDNYDELLNQIDEIQSGFSISESSLIKVAYIETLDEKSSYLFISVHHLVIDGVSWRILLDDLWNAYGQISQNKKITLPLKTTSYKEWVEKLNDYANSEKVGEMLNYWKDNLPGDIGKLPLDYDKRAENLEDSSDVLMTSLSKEDTDSLQHRIQNTQIGLLSINELLIAALYKTITQWTNSSSLYIDLENHGRDTQFSDQIDVSRTIGWFTSIYPLFIKAESVDGSISEVGNIISMIKEKINGIPDKGISYSLLKYLNKNNTLSENIRRYPTPEMSYNYLGQFNQEISQSGYEILSSAVKK
ncbi:MAG: condensation domain-containing protein, partial [Bacteroidota bacterium]|nr:condensation domain-containing protein [Bacteroidota bacterium]